MGSAHTQHRRFFSLNRTISHEGGGGAGSRFGKRGKLFAPALVLIKCAKHTLTHHPSLITHIFFVLRGRRTRMAQAAHPCESMAPKREGEPKIFAENFAARLPSLDTPILTLARVVERVRGGFKPQPTAHQCSQREFIAQLELPLTAGMGLS